MQCHIILTIWTWLIQITVWISLFIILLYTYYELKLSNIKNIYPEQFDENHVPYYSVIVMKINYNLFSYLHL